MNFLGTGPVLIVAAHPDDDVLGCGGTMARLSRDGVAVSVLFFTDGVGARSGDEEGQSHAAARRTEAAAKSVALLGAQLLPSYSFPDNRLDTVALLDLAKCVEETIIAVKPAVVLTHHPGDLNIDHRCVHEAVMTACRPQPESIVKTVLCFETASSTEWRAPAAGSAFVPNLWVDISVDLPSKLAALSCYADEMREWPHARSLRALEHLARWRGAACGCEAAEAFMVARTVL